MSYRMTVSQTTTPDIFNALREILSFLKLKFETENKDELLKLFKTEFNIIITQPKDSILDYNVDFTSEENFTWIMLKWG